MNYAKPLAASVIVAAATVLSLTIPGAVAANETTSAAGQESPTDKELAETPTENELSTSTYTVKPGDYLSAIALEHDISWPSIYELNQEIENPDIIHPGQELVIPNRDVPLTRGIPQASTLAIPADYQPQVPSHAGNAAGSQPQPVVQTPSVPASVPGLGLVLGRPYVYGGSSPATGFDCSGLTQFLAGQRGISLPRTSAGQYHALPKISLAQALPGDIIAFNLGHVGTYLGGGRVVHALNPAQGIRIEDVQTAIRYNGFLSALAVGR